MLKRFTSRGDTIIEVLFATTVFSMVAVGGLSIMNQGTAMAQRSLEIVLVRQQIDAQADALRYLNQAYVSDYGLNGAATARWNSVIKERAVEQAQDFDAMVGTADDPSMEPGLICKMPSNNEKPFALDTKKLNSDPVIQTNASAATYAKVNYENTNNTVTGDGLWIQAVRSNGGEDKPGFYDFHIRACWKSPGQAAPITLGTIVRLYEPRG